MNTNKLWKLFLEEVRIWSKLDNTPKNFLGSVDKHKECFDQAVKKLKQDKEIDMADVNAVIKVLRNKTPQQIAEELVSVQPMPNLTKEQINTLGEALEHTCISRQQSKGETNE